MNFINQPLRCRNTVIWTNQLIRNLKTDSKSGEIKVWRKWHQDYNSYKKEYKKLIQQLNIYTQNREICSKINALYGQKNVKLALGEWDRLWDLIDRSSSDYKGGSNVEMENNNYLGSLPSLLIKLFKDDKALFNQFFKRIYNNELEMDIIPELINHLYKKKKDENTMIIELVKYLETQYETTNLHEKALNKGISEHIRLLMKEKKWQNVCYFLDSIATTGIKLNKEITDMMLWLPQYTLPHLYKSLLPKSNNLHSSFVKKVYKSSDVGRDLVINTDMAFQQLDSKSTPKFSEKTYQWILTNLSREQDKDSTKWMLENIYLRHFGKKNWSLLLYTAMEIEGIQAAAEIYEFMIRHNVELTEPDYLTLLRGFRKNAFEARFIDVCNLANEQGYLRNYKLQTEILSLIADRYDPSVVYAFYKHLYGSIPTIEDYLVQNRRVKYEDDDVPKPSVALENLVFQLEPHCSSWSLAALKIMYRAALHTVEDVETMIKLYEEYVNFAGNNLSMRVIDVFIINLCQRFKSRTAVDTAHDIFTDAIQRGASNKYKSHAVKLLIQKHCETIKSVDNISYKGDVAKAIEIFNLAVENDTPVTQGLVNPIIVYYKKNRQLGLATQWQQKGQLYGAVLEEEDNEHNE